MKCEEDMLALLDDYVGGTGEPSVCEEFATHMAGCDPCQMVVDNIRKTITLYRDGQPYELPPPLHDRLHECLRARWKETHTSKQTST